jgi:hypothetical protein
VMLTALARTQADAQTTTAIAAVTTKLTGLAPRCGTAEHAACSRPILIVSPTGDVRFWG